jgi:hypothetical protein
MCNGKVGEDRVQWCCWQGWDFGAEHLLNKDHLPFLLLRPPLDLLFFCSMEKDLVGGVGRISVLIALVPIIAYGIRKYATSMVECAC